MDADHDPAPRLPVSRGERRVLLVLAAGFVALLGADIIDGFNRQKLGAVFVLAFWLPMLAVHALGHAIAARLVGYRLAELGIGLGRELWHFSLGGMRVRVRTLPLEGYALIRPSSGRPGRVRRAIAHLGGSLGNLTLLALLAPTLELRLPHPDDGLALIALQSLALAAALAALYPLVPYRCAGNPSDGLTLLECIFASRETLLERHASAFALEARRLLHEEQPAGARALLEQALSRLPGEPRLLGLRAVCQAAEGDSAGAYAALEALGPPEARPPALRAELIADAAWAVLLSHDEASLPDAQRAAERASEAYPDDPHYQLLLARACFERGKFESAYMLFMSAYKRARDADQEAQCVAYLALACRALQRGAGAIPFADHAERFEAAVRAQDVPRALRQRVLGGSHGD